MSLQQHKLHQFMPLHMQLVAGQDIPHLANCLCPAPPRSSARESWQSYQVGWWHEGAAGAA